MPPLPAEPHRSTGPTAPRVAHPPTQRLTVAVFPGAGDVHLYHALDSGYFDRAGLDVDLVEVVSSDQQLAGWNDGDYDVMHTSPDHLLRSVLKRDPVAVRAEGIGELAVHRRPGEPTPTDRWAVDNAQSAFAFVLRAVLADVVGLPVAENRLEPVGGTLQRFRALLAGPVDGTTLHPPFDVLGAEQGYPRLGGHLQTAPDLITNVVLTPRATATSWYTRAYLQVCSTSASELLTSGAPGIEAALVRHGWPPATARAAVPGLLGPAGLSTSPEVTLRGLGAVADLRRRFDPAWRPAHPLLSLIGPGPGN
ncbi:ABC transporter substrate-binding protein [Streptomyces sp. NPDC058676]|uniref:ABC transporter substrate-binding protein n=1 Tax=unclassified Streptomyces TaxID=2593676 RepID=UPI00364CA030